MGGLSLISNDLTAANDLADSEEPDDFGSGNTNQSPLLGAKPACPAEETLGRKAKVLEGRRVANGVDQGLEVRLEGGDVSVSIVREEPPGRNLDR
jgi:hypothetical protein